MRSFCVYGARVRGFILAHFGASPMLEKSLLFLCVCVCVCTFACRCSQGPSRASDPLLVQDLPVVVSCPAWMRRLGGGRTLAFCKSLKSSLLLSLLYSPQRPFLHRNSKCRKAYSQERKAVSHKKNVKCTSQTIQ